jgi:alanine dehydrogenase
LLELVPKKGDRPVINSIKLHFPCRRVKKPIRDATIFLKDSDTLSKEKGTYLAKLSPMHQVRGRLDKGNARLERFEEGKDALLAG